MANEKRLIYAEKLKQILKECINENYDQTLFVKIMTKFCDILDKCPTVDAVEVVHGEWDVITDDCMFDVIYQCSVCKEEFVTNDGTPAENLWHYCPNCGAKMDGGNEDV